MPFRKESFNHIYSLGVLHHTPDTERAFKAVSAYLKGGGEFAVFIYVYSQYHYFSDIWRRITTRIPTKFLYYLSSIAIPLYYLHKIPFVGKAINLILPTSDFPDSRWRWLDTLDWYSPMYQWKHTWPEVFRWYKEEGFSDIELFQEDNDYQICMRGKKA
jgi:SAM-dependent methyltransferase